MELLTSVFLFGTCYCATERQKSNIFESHKTLDIGCVQVGGIRGLGDTSARSGTTRNHRFACKAGVYMTVQ
jgi:hypothetical protein